MKKLLIFILIILVSLSACVESNDPYSLQWSYNNYGQKINGIFGISGIDINYQNAYDCPDDFPIIAVIDSGFNLNHPHFANQIFLEGYDFIENRELINDDLASHGTGILGVLVSPDSDEMKGLLKNSKILPIRVFDGNNANVNDIIEAIIFAENEGAKIVNCSFTLDFFNQDLFDTIKYSSMIFICAAGNDYSKKVQFPAAYDLPNVISVLGINHLGFVSKFSNYEEKVFISAPGENVYCPQANEEYAYMNGSSIAVPFITAASAILYYKIQDNDIRKHLIECATQKKSLNGFVNQGKLINFEKVLHYKMVNKRVAIR